MFGGRLNSVLSFHAEDQTSLFFQKNYKRIFFMKRLLPLLLLCFLMPLSALAATIDLQVSSYTWTPDPVVNNGTASFSLSVQNNGPGTSAASTLTVALPATAAYAGNVSGCSFSSPNLTCPIAPLALGESANVSYTATGNGTGVQSTTATISKNAADTDTNAANNTLIKTLTIIKGADLSITHTGPGGCTSSCNETAGSTISYTLTVNNDGPGPATTFRVVDDLPATIDFTYQSAIGTDWSCSHTGTTLTCNYAGSSILTGNSAPAITVTGQIVTTAGLITNGASVASTDVSTSDPDLTNNGPVLRVVNVTAGTDLRANKTMVSDATGLTSYVNGEAVTLTLSATNTGTQQATGVTVTDTVSADFTVGVLPGACSAIGQDVTCTVGTLNGSSTSSSFAIPLTVVGSVGASGTNTANVTRVGPAGSDTPASVDYSVVTPFAKLTITKTKSPVIDSSPSNGDPVKTGTKILNTIVVRNSNSSTTAATGTVTVVETLNNHPNETFDALTTGSATAGWVCVDGGATISCNFPISVSLARGASLPTLRFTTNAVGANMNLRNEVCTGGNLSAHSPADSDLVPDCSGLKTLYSAAPDIDIGITKIVDDNAISISDTTFTYTITVTNHSGTDTAPTVVVADAIPMYYNGPAGTTGIVPTLIAQGAGESCTGTSTVTCTVKNLTPGQTRSITIAVTRPVLDGTNITNTASWDSPDIVQTTNIEPDTASINVTIDPIADVALTSIADAPDPVKVGVALTYTTSIKNNGPSTAAGIVLRHTIDTSKMPYVPSSAALTGSDGSCAFVTGFVGAPHAGLNGIECTGFSLANNESRQLTFDVIPAFPFPGGLGAYNSTSTVTTTTTESNADNNTLSNTANVIAKDLDLAITKNEAFGYDPDGAGPLSNLLHDPVAFGDKIFYLVTLRNNGPSQATGVTIFDTLTPPSGWESTYNSVVYDAANSDYSPANGVSCSVTGGTVPGTYASPQQLTCYLGTGAGDSILPSGNHVTLKVEFTTGGNQPSSSITYSNSATVESAETGASPFTGDALTANNSVTENSTVLPKTDLYIEKTADAGIDGDNSPYNINETFNYLLTIGNQGTNIAPGVVVTDALPSGFVAAGNVTVTPGAGVTLATNSCNGSAWIGSCNIGPLPIDLTGADATKQVTISIPVRAAYPYAGPIDTDITNTATIAPAAGTSIDPNATNNSASVDVQIRKNSIAGTVYADNNQNNQNDTVDGGEGINNVILTLSGTDAYSNSLSGITTTTNSSGVYLFDRLPPGTYSVVETQPSGYWDRFETVGSEGGTKPADVCDGSTNCAATAIQNTISGITLAPVTTSTAGTGYIFQEYQRARLQGYVYHDANNDGDRDSETGVASLSNHVTLSGNAYNGIDVQTLVTETLSLNGNGRYYYTNLPPSDGSGYTLQQNNQPSGYFDGKDQTGNGTGNVVASSNDHQIFGVVANSNSETISAGTLTPNQTKKEFNFGELLPASIAGSVFIDANTNAVKDGSETVGVPGVTVTLTGTDYLGNPVNTPATTNASGVYSFTRLLLGTYTLTETSPSGMTHTGSQAGTEGGSGAGIGAGNVAISSISLEPNDVATGYNFGESGEGLSGFVYVDSNGNGVKDGGEPGIAGVTVTLSGNAQAGSSVCGYVASCSLVTNGTGGYSITNLPASDGTGYTLTEQSQTALPLSGYADGTDVVGSGVSIPGTAGNDVVTGIGVVLGEMGVNYNFGELLGSLAGSVYFDTNNDGVKDAGESGIDDIPVTLTGYTWGTNGSDDSGAGDDVAITAIPTATAGGGYYSFSSLLRGTYTVTETHPNDWGDGKETAGTSGGTALNNGFDNTATNNRITSISLTVGSDATGYLFGERSSGLSGRVCEDANNDGICQGGEIGIDNIAVTLSGTTTVGGADICTFIAPASCSVVTPAGGAYSFPDLPAGIYTLTETHPTIYLDGKENTGNLGGTVDNTGFDASVGRNRVTAIPLLGGQNGTDYDFGEQPLTDATLSGHVWLDNDHNRVLDGGEALQTGWTVEVWHSGTKAYSVTTDSAGFYSVNVAPNTGYELRFVHPSAGTVFGRTVPNESNAAYTVNNISAGNPTGGDNSSGVLSNMTVISGANIPEQSLPLDPSGVVYESVTRDPVAGAQVAISGPGGFNAAAHLLGGVANVTQTTGNDGFYQFLLLPGAPAGSYSLAVIAPAGLLPAPSVLIRPCTSELTVDAVPDPALVHSSNTAPVTASPVHDPAVCPVNTGELAASANSSQYYFNFAITPGVSGDVVNNHIPLDPILEGAITVVKTTPKKDVVRGELVPYKIIATNTLAATLANIGLQDLIPAGFKYVSSSATIDGVAMEPVVNGRHLSWPGLTFAPAQVKTAQLILIVGSGVGEGKYVNQAWAKNTVADVRLSNIGTATVRVVPDPLFDCSDLVGKVFDDTNVNGYQDEGEPGLAGVRVATVRGQLITTDRYGRFHLACADVPNELHGSNFIMKMDERTLPSGYRVTTENPRVVRMTRGKLVKLNFGAGLHRVVRIDLTSNAFAKDGDALTEISQQKLEGLITLLEQEPSVLRLVYSLKTGETNDDIEQRISLLKDQLEERWEDCDCSRYTLDIETEVLSAGANATKPVATTGEDAK
jgi:large repetitive protein